MHEVVKQRLAALCDVCRLHHVRRLEVFGSATGEGFDPARSDVDFLVEYLPDARHGFSGDYFGLKEDLETLFGRDVDLVMTTAARNPYFLRGIAPSRTVVYKA